MNNIGWSNSKSLLARDLNKGDKILAQKETQKFLFLGDMMLDRKVKDFWLVSNDVCEIFTEYDKFMSKFEKGEITSIVNFESPIADKKYVEGHHYRLSCPTQFMKCFPSRFDLANLANNHILDQGMRGFYDTISNFKKMKIPYSGIGHDLKEAWSGEYLPKSNGQIAMISTSFTCYNDDNTTDCSIVSRISDKLVHIEKSINAYKKENPNVFLILAMHNGLEYDPIHNSVQSGFAKTAIDLGIDIVIGHHPHVVQDIEFYKGSPIMYSLGNFIFDQDWSKTGITQKGLGVILKFSFNSAAFKPHLEDIEFYRIDIGGNDVGFMPSISNLHLEYQYYNNLLKKCHKMESFKSCEKDISS